MLHSVLAYFFARLSKGWISFTRKRNPDARLPNMEKKMLLREMERMLEKKSCHCAVLSPKQKCKN